MCGIVDYVIVSTTIDDAEKADLLAGKLVEESLAACVQIVPIKSVYRWEGAIKRADEFMLTAKTRHELANTVVEFIKAEHSYDLPEVVITDITGGSRDYLNWITESTS